MRAFPALSADRVRNILPATLTLVALLAFLAALGKTYVGHGSSPYGVCYGPTGRSVPCEVASRGSATPR
jgi:hypothetical protein